MPERRSWLARDAGTYWMIISWILCAISLSTIYPVEKNIPVFLPGETHGQRSLVGCSPWGCKEADMTEWLNNNYMPRPSAGDLQPRTGSRQTRNKKTNNSVLSGLSKEQEMGNINTSTKQNPQPLPDSQGTNRRCDLPACRHLQVSQPRSYSSGITGRWSDLPAAAAAAKPQADPGPTLLLGTSRSWPISWGRISCVFHFPALHRVAKETQAQQLLHIPTLSGRWSPVTPGRPERPSCRE